MSATGRFLGFCLAATLAPAALCAAPVTGSGLGTRTPLIKTSDIPPSTTGPAAVRKAADLQSPLSKSGIRNGNDRDAPSTADRALSDGVHRTLGAHSAVMDSDKAAIGQAEPQAADADQTPSLKVRPLTDHERTVYGVAQGGLVVTDVGQGAAQQAGFRQGDVVLMLDGVSLSDTTQFYHLIHQLPHDRPVPVLVRRPNSDLFLPLGSLRR